MEIRMEEIERKLQTCEEKSVELDKTVERLTSGAEVETHSKTSVSFSATAVRHQYEARQDQTLVFEEVLTNVGGCYNHVSGEFTAPVAGTYFIHSTVLSGNGAEIWLSITVNNTRKAKFYARGTDGRHDTASQALVLVLNKGDVVSAKNEYDGGKIYGQTYTTFSGFLIR